MRIVVTGATGFLGWHVRCRLRAQTADAVVVAVGRDDGAGLPDEVARADLVLHLAGVNRGSPEEIVTGNIELAEQVAEGVRRARTPPHVVYANSVQAGNGTPYGDAKAAAAAILRRATDMASGTFVDVLLPNLFGEHGRPDYNSFVTTFCRDLLIGRRPVVVDRELALMHAQVAAGTLISAGAPGTTSGVESPAGEVTSVAAVLAQLESYADLYAHGDIPPLRSDFDTDLFNTFRAAAFPANSPIALTSRVDERGSLVECVRAHGGSGQTFMSTTAPGFTRGQHFHLRKVERFVVLQGTAEIALRRMFGESVVKFAVTGEDVVAVDMPTMWTHRVTNVGSSALITMFWTDSVFDSGDTDTWHEPVEAEHRTLAVA